MSVEIERPKPRGAVCPDCGALLEADDWFCRECGHVVRRGESGRSAGDTRSPGGATGKDSGGKRGGSSYHSTNAASKPASDVHVSELSRLRARETSIDAAPYYMPDYVSDPAPSPVPRILAVAGAVLVAGAIGWFVAGGKLPWAASSTGTASFVGSNAAANPASTPGAAASQGSSTSEPSPASRNVTFTLVQRPLTWDEAEAYCEAHGGCLAQPQTQEELEKIKALVCESDARAIWLGATRDESGESGSETGFVWLDGTPVANCGFAAGEPNNEGGMENRLALLRSGDSCQIYDVPSSFASLYPEGIIGFVMEQQ